MNQKQENQLARLNNVDQFLASRQQTVAKVGALQAAYAVFSKKLDDLPTLPEANIDATSSGTPLDGAMMAKGSARAALEAPTIAICNALRLYFKARYDVTHDVEDLQRSAEMTLLRPGNLRRTMSDGELQRLLGRVLDCLTFVEAGELKEKYNHDDAKIDHFSELALRYGAVRHSPRQAIDKGKVEGESFAQDLKTAREFIKSDLLPAVLLLIEDDPAFVRGFKQANKQIDRRGGQSARPVKSPSTPE